VFLFIKESGERGGVVGGRFVGVVRWLVAAGGGRGWMVVAGCGLGGCGWRRTPRLRRVAGELQKVNS